MPSEILIAGAGPSGLTLALELTRRNIPFEIFDKAPGPAPIAESRALAVNPRSQAILAPSGVSAEIRKQGHVIEHARFSWQGKPLATVQAELPDHPGKKIISIPQGRVERVLLADLATRGVEPRWNTNLVDFSQTRENVTAIVATGSSTERITGRYLVGCDGAHSVVRKSGGYYFDGQSDPQTWEMADIELGTSEFANSIWADFVPGGANATIAMGDTYVRVIRSALGDIADHPLMPLATKLHWKSRFKVSYRMVRQFRRDRTFLCGDAAHIHSPVGGRGMNLGIEDAATLAFLLSEGREGEYSDLRIPIARKVLDFTHTQTRQLLSKSRFNHFAKRHLLPVALKFAPVRNSVLTSVLAFDTPEPEWLQSLN